MAGGHYAYLLDAHRLLLPSSALYINGLVCVCLCACVYIMCVYLVPIPQIFFRTRNQSYRIGSQREVSDSPLSSSWD